MHKNQTKQHKQKAKVALKTYKDNNDKNTQKILNEPKHKKEQLKTEIEKNEQEHKVATSSLQTKSEKNQEILTTIASMIINSGDTKTILKLLDELEH